MKMSFADDLTYHFHWAVPCEAPIPLLLVRALVGSTAKRRFAASRAGTRGLVLPVAQRNTSQR